jgi:RHS repeat-associated protein
VKRTDAAGNVTCYTHDALHRVTAETYPSGPNSGNTPSKFFVYDSATVNSIVMANAKTRLAEAYTCTSGCSSKLTDEGFSYTARGEVSDTWESTPNSSGYFHVNETYWANGLLNTISGLAGLPTLTYGPDGEGRTYMVSASSGQNPVTSTFYNSASEVTQLTFGSTSVDDYTYDLSTFRMTQYQFKLDKTVTGALTWNPNWSLASLQITDGFNSGNDQTCSYSADDLARLASVNCGSLWSQTFSYDAFGKITKSGSNSFQPTYSPSTNRMTLIGSLTPTYDADGDVTKDSLFTFTWDSTGRPTEIAGVAELTYDALERMVEQDKSGSYGQIVYDPSGNKLAVMNTTSTLKEAFAPLPAGAKAVYYSSGLQFYWNADWLGSWRLSSSPSEGLDNERYYAPFGEQYPSTGSVLTASFARNDEDTGGYLYDAAYREYEVLGRWPSPDPAGMAAANPGNPQSWNRYAYVLNNPLAMVDPSGLDCRWVGNILDCPFWFPSADGSGGGGGGGGGGRGCAFLAGPVCPGSPQSPPTPQSPGFTLGIRAPGQSYGVCMAANANTYSLSGSVELGINVATGTNTNFSQYTSFVAGNSINSFLFGSTADAAGTMAASAPGLVSTAMGTATTFGRRTSSIISLNLAGAGGLPMALSPASAGVKSALGSIGNVLSLGLSFVERTAVDAAFTGAEAINCAIPQ